MRSQKDMIWSYKMVESSAKPLNNIQIQDLPVITVTSKTGSGALIKPVIGKLPLTPQGELFKLLIVLVQITYCWLH